ncbi:hypothetical protein D039_1396A, partial [Vibrio parahaemolyticus EKP-028]
MLPLAPL